MTTIDEIEVCNGKKIKVGDRIYTARFSTTMGSTDCDIKSYIAEKLRDDYPYCKGGLAIECRIWVIAANQAFATREEAKEAAQQVINDKITDLIYLRDNL